MKISGLYYNHALTATINRASIVIFIVIIVLYYVPSETMVSYLANNVFLTIK